MTRGDIWWASIPRSLGSEPGGRRPVLIVQANAFNDSSIRTVIVIILTSNLGLADAPGNVFVPRAVNGLPRDSVANVSQVLTLDRGMLNDRVGALPPHILARIDDGLRLVMEL